MTSIETKTFQFLTEIVAAAVDEEDPLHELEVHDTPYQKITRAKGVRIFEAVSTFRPTPGAATVEEFNGDLKLVAWRKLLTTDLTERLAARDEVLTIAAAICTKVFDGNTLGGRVCDAFPGDITRDYDNVESKVYAVAEFHLLINRRG